MTPRQARVALGGFLLLAAGVTGNALHLQGGKASPPPPERPNNTSKPAKTVERATSPATEKSAALRKQGAETAPEASPDEADAETVRTIQHELKRRGYGPLVADGVMRPTARAAIMAFEHEHRLPLTGEATQALLKRLVFGVPVATETAVAAEVRSPHAEAVIKQVQRLLAARGYRPGAIDGRLSTQTTAAIKAFETDQGVAAKGRISAEVLARLEAGPAEAKRPKGR